MMIITPRTKLPRPQEGLTSVLLVLQLWVMLLVLSRRCVTTQQEQLLSCGQSSEIYKNQHTSTDDSGEPRFAVVEFHHDDDNVVGTGVAPHVGTAVDDGVASGDILCSATTTNKHAVTALYLCTWSPVIYNYESIIHTSIKSLGLDHGRWIECVCIPSANHCELLTTGHEVATATIIGPLECYHFHDCCWNLHPNLEIIPWPIPLHFTAGKHISRYHFCSFRKRTEQ